MSPDVVRNVVSGYFAALRAMDVEAWLDTFAPDAVSHDPAGSPALEGHGALRQFFQGVTGLFETVGLTEDHVFVAGYGAAVKWTGRGVGKNGRQVVFEGIDVFEINPEGKIAKLWAYWNPAPVLQEVSR